MQKTFLVESDTQRGAVMCERFKVAPIVADGVL